MGDFFLGWRRKAGCILLAFTLSVCALWARTLAYEDRIVLTGMNRVWEILSSHQRISCLEWNDHTIRNTDWNLTVDYLEEWEPRRDPSRTDWHFYYRNPPNWCWSCPYWSIVLFLTFDAACLFLWKPRPKSPGLIDTP